MKVEEFESLTHNQRVSLICELSQLAAEKIQVVKKQQSINQAAKKDVLSRIKKNAKW